MLLMGIEPATPFERFGTSLSCGLNLNCAFTAPLVPSSYNPETVSLKTGSGEIITRHPKMVEHDIDVASVCLKIRVE